jgi:hypothetical protein
MNRLAQTHQAQTPLLSLHEPQESPVNSARWRINGFPAKIIIWTAEEWERLAERPTDAQRLPSGTWCALRMD